MEANIDLRLLRTEDLPAADKLRHAAGWNQTPADWRRFLDHDPDGCFVATDGNQVVGTATTTSFRTDLAWIGMVLVDPTRRNQGIGRKLLAKCLEHLKVKGVRCIKLDATPAGQVLYEKLGFQVEWPFTRWMRMDVTVAGVMPLAKATMSTVADWDPITQLDLRVFGLDRSPFLARLAKDSRLVIASRDNSNEATGYGFLREGVNADYVGPIIVQTAEAGKAILLSLLSAARAQVYWDIPSPSTDAAKLAVELGFVEQRPLLRMHLGPNAIPGQPQFLWAISDPATG